MPSNRWDDAKTKPSDSAAIRARMSELRTELSSEVETAKQQAAEATDWKSYVHKYPLATVGIAATIGYFVIPKATNVIQLSDKQLKTLAKQGGVNVTAGTTGKGNPSTFKTLLMTAGGFALKTAMPHVLSGLQNKAGMTGTDAAGAQPETAATSIHE